MATSNETMLKKLISERSHVKAQLTKFKKYCDEKGTSVGLEALEERLNRNQTLLDKFEIFQNQIETIVSGAPEENEQQLYRENFEELYFNVIGQVRAYIKRARNPTVPVAPAASRPTTASPAGTESSSLIKLPAIPLPTFNGNLGDWVYFRDSFESLVNRNEALSNIERFHYLKSSVKGEAARALSSLAMSDENYTVAWKLLKDRYEDADELIDFHVRALFQCSSMTKDSSISLRQMLDEFENNLRSLMSLKEPVEQWDSLLVYLLSRKLDSRTVEAWNKRVSELDRKKTLKDLQGFLDQHCKFLAKSGKTVPSIQVVSGPRESIQKPRSRPVTLYTTDTSQCPLCKSNHILAQCSDFRALTAADRVNKVKDLHLCFNCLRPGHGVKTCVAGTCRKCQQKHHTSIHVWKSANSGANNQVQFKPTMVSSPEARCDTTAAIGDSNKSVKENIQQASYSQSFTTSRLDDHEQVLLSTAIIHVIDSKGNRHECRALLDQGSQVNILKTSFAQRLG